MQLNKKKEIHRKLLEKKGAKLILLMNDLNIHLKKNLRESTKKLLEHGRSLSRLNIQSIFNQ